MNEFNFNKALEEYKNGGELVNIVIRNNGNREDYRRLYSYIKFGGVL